MKQNKRQNRIKNILKNPLFWLVITLSSVLGFGLIQNSTSYFCSKNPDKCVCEEEISICKQKGYHLSRAYSENYELECCNDNKCYQPTEFKCSKFSKKTQDELLIDDCNNNPRDDENCKCEKIISGMSVYIKDRVLFGIGHPLYVNDTLEIYLISKCTKSRPKTECEKGDPDWVEETNPSYKNDFEWFNNSIWWFCDFLPTNYPNEIGDKYIPSYSERCIFYKNQLAKLNQTICRKR